MKRSLLASLGALSLLTSVARADHGTDWDRWYSGSVEVRLSVAGGAGTVVRSGDQARLAFRVDEDAYVMVYAIDAAGWVRLLWPRYWAEDGWVEAGHTVRLGGRNLAWPLERCGGDGAVYVQAVASPLPFDWNAVGLVAGGDGCEWWADERPLRVHGDPLLGFNEINRRIFPAWDEAVFAADQTWFYVGHRHDHPLYLCGVCAGRHHGYHDPWVRVQIDVVWDMQRGRRYCRPVYRPHYVYAGDRSTLRYRHDGRDRRGASDTAPVYREVRSRPLPDVKRERERERRDERRRTTRMETPRQPPALAADDRRGRPAGDRSPSPDRRLERRAPAPNETREAAHGVRRVEVPRRGATPPAPDAAVQQDGRRRREVAPHAAASGSRARPNLANPPRSRSAAGRETARDSGRDRDSKSKRQRAER
jgi:hypothetical protein